MKIQVFISTDAERKRKKLLAMFNTFMLTTVQDMQIDYIYFNLIMSSMR